MTTPKTTRVETAREVSVRRLIDGCSYGAAAAALIPLPGTETIGVLSIHVGMVVGIAKQYGHEITRKDAGRLVARIGAAVGLSWLGTRAVSFAAKTFVPFLGAVAVAPLMFVSTRALGRVVQAWYSQGGTLDEAELREIYRAEAVKARSEFDPKRARSTEARRAAEAAREEEQGEHWHPEDDDVTLRLRKLARLHAEGLITDDEYAAKKGEILESL